MTTSFVHSVLYPVLMTLLSALSSYAIYRASIYLNASGLGKKLANAESLLQKKLGQYIGQKTLAEAEALLEDEIAAEIAHVVHLPVAQIITIGKGILRVLFPVPAPAPDPTPSPAK